MTLIDFIKFVIVPILIAFGVYTLNQMSIWTKKMGESIEAIKLELAKYMFHTENNTKIALEHKEMIEHHSKMLLEHDRELTILINKN